MSVVSKSILSFDSLPWRCFSCPKSQLRLDITLKCGQSFRWSRYDEDKEGEDSSWVGVLRGKVWLLSQDEKDIRYKSLPDEEGGGKEEDEQEILRDYFQLDVDLSPLYERWSQADPVFEKIGKSYSGVRMLRQDPVENLFSFICSSNNNIQRISSMVENLCTHYGDVVCRVKKTKDEDDESKSREFFSFPSVSQLAGGGSAGSTKVEQKLRTLGFGYRAAYIAKTAQALEKKGGETYLMSLRKMDHEEARKELLQLTGIGPKVADCILLMSLDKPSSIPVDTHMFQIAATKYLPHLKSHKSVTDKVYREIGELFRGLYGEYAGWAHSVLFSADLKHLQDKDEEREEPSKKKKRK